MICLSRLNLGQILNQIRQSLQYGWPVRPKRWVEDSPNRYYRHSQANHGPSPSESVVVTFNQRSASNASQLSKDLISCLKGLDNPEIYSGGASTDKSPRKGRFRTAIEEETLQVNENDLKILPFQFVKLSLRMEDYGEGKIK